MKNFTANRGNKMTDNHVSINVKNERDQQILFEQYKILFESINKTNETRENSNNFWIGANGVGVSILAYFRNATAMAYNHKVFFLGTLCVVGIEICPKVVFAEKREGSVT
jgi:hypothetical protein